MRIIREEVLEVEGLKVILQYKDVQNISIKIDKESRILVGVPYFSLRGKEQALDFVRQKLPWLRKHLEARSAQELPLPDNGFDGENIWLWGKHYKAVFTNAALGTPVAVRGEELIFSYRGTLTERKKQLLVEKFYGECFQKMLEAALKSWQPKLGLYASGCKIQRLKSKWGRCNVVTRELLFNLSLVHRPLACLEYVVLHELAHLYEASHNQRFKNFLSNYMPDWKDRRNLVNKFVFKV